MSEQTRKYPATFEEWMRDTLEPDTIQDLSNYGASGGFPGLTYYSDTTALYEEYEDEIWQLLYDEAEAHGLEHPLQLIAFFAGASNVATDAQFKNLLVWFIAEETAHRLADEEEEA